jgi:uncharacterized membrane protein YhaH (DUF805 family)
MAAAGLLVGAVVVGEWVLSLRGDASEVLVSLYLFAVLYCLTVWCMKRLHDWGRSGVWICLPLACIVAALAVAILHDYHDELFPDLHDYLHAMGWYPTLIEKYAIGLAYLFLLFLHVAPGQRLANRFGPPPPGNSRAVRLLSGLGYVVGAGLTFSLLGWVIAPVRCNCGELPYYDHCGIPDSQEKPHHGKAARHLGHQEGEPPQVKYDPFHRAGDG